jgi:hypothetical protein
MQTATMNKVRAELASAATKTRRTKDQAEAKLRKFSAEAAKTIAKLKAEFAAAHTAHEAAETEHKQFNEFCGASAANAAKNGKAATVKAAPKAPAKAKAAAKGPKVGKKGPPKAKAKAKKEGGGLTMIEAMVKVIGNKVLGAGQIADGLKAAGTAPKSKKLNAYISSVLSSATKDGEKVFIAVKRGEYCVAANHGKREIQAMQKEAATKSDAKPKAATKRGPRARKATAAPATKTDADEGTAETPTTTSAPAEDGMSAADRIVAEVGMPPEAFRQPAADQAPAPAAAPLS